MASRREQIQLPTLRIVAVLVETVVIIALLAWVFLTPTCPPSTERPPSVAIPTPMLPTRELLPSRPTASPTPLLPSRRLIRWSVDDPAGPVSR